MIVGATRKIWEHCLRGFLRRQIEKLAAQELHLKAVSENEFYLLRRSETGNLVPADDTVFCATGSMNQHTALVDDLAEDIFERIHLDQHPLHPGQPRDRFPGDQRSRYGPVYQLCGA